MAFLSNDDSLWEPCIMWLTRERHGDTDRDTEKSSSIAAEGKWNHTATEEIPLVLAPITCFIMHAGPFLLWEGEKKNSWWGGHLWIVFFFCKGKSRIQI
jgi:hypothetical protein